VGRREVREHLERVAFEARQRVLARTGAGGPAPPVSRPSLPPEVAAAVRAGRAIREQHLAARRIELTLQRWRELPPYERRALFPDAADRRLLDDAAANVIEGRRR
jgi:hypothetical protein